jgi:hypothetical protein
MIVEHPTLTLVRLDRGGFEIRAETGDPVRARTTGTAWRVDGGPLAQPWRLERRDPVGGGFCLREAAADAELGRTMWLGPPGQLPELRYLLLGDGSLYRIVLRGPADGRYELSGWEVPGPYLTARPGEGGWTIVPQPASGGLTDCLALSLLFAAEILDADAALDPETVS